MLTLIRKIQEQAGLVDVGTVIRKNRSQLLCVFTLFYGMATIGYFFLSQMVERQIYSNAEEVLTTVETVVQGELNEAEIALTNASFSVLGRLSEGLPEGKSIAGIKKYFDQISDKQQQSPQGLAGFMAIYGYINGKFVIAPDWVPPAEFREPGRPWYQVAEQSPGKVVFTTPYIDARTDKVILSASLSLRGAAGENYGVIALDIDLSEFSKYIQKSRFSADGYGMLLNENYAILAYYSSEFLGMPLSYLGPLHAKITERLTEKEHISGLNMKNVKGDNVVSFYRKMPNGWFVGISMPYDGYYHYVYYMAALLAILATCSGIILSIFLLRMSYRQIHADEENKSKSSFLARMSHEIRTPMNTIYGMSEMLMHQDVSSDIKEYVSIIHQSGAGLLAIINDVLDFSRIEAGQLLLEHRGFIFSSFINDVINVIRVRVVNTPIYFTVNVDPDIPECLIGDEVRLRQLLINLLNNAVKYTSEGFVSLRIEIGQREYRTLTLIFIVEDSGIGIKDEDIGKLFTEFTRLDEERNQGIEGAGLGLSIARMISRKMGGDISVSSKYGQGSVFTATVIQSVEADSPVIAKVASGNMCRVLVLEFREIYLKSLRRELLALEVSTIITKTKAEFLSALESDKYSHVFVPALYALELIYELELRKSPVRIVIMAELRDVSSFQDIQSVLMPVYSATLANALNGVQMKNVESIAQQKYMAPSAKVLVVDDMSTNLRVAKELIERYGVKVDICSNGADSIRYVKEKHYDMVFMDHMMPGIDGLQATAAIREFEDKRPQFVGNAYTTTLAVIRKQIGEANSARTDRLPIIALTANVMSGQKEMFLQAGMDDFLAKPIEMQKLYNILRKWIPQEKWVSGSTKTDETKTGRFGDFVIDGLDVEAGIKSAGGSERNYEGILMEFCISTPGLIGQAREAIGQQDYYLYTTIVHGIKSALRVIGAKMLGKCAEILEAAGNSKDADQIEKYSETFLKAVSDLSEQINNSLTMNAATAKAFGSGAGLNASQLMAIKTALLDMDNSSVNKLLVELVNSTTSHDEKHKLLEIENDILLFEYESAIKKIDDWLSDGT
jgi:signal transduction histidine kinase/CheY-like chemotaxis protein/HPt (histidine-containing phosphotransfer) domain-containing protein